MLFSVPPMNKYMCLKSPDEIIQMVTWGKSDGTFRLGEGFWESETSLSCSREILSCFFLVSGETSSFCVSPPCVMTGSGADDGGFAQAWEGPLCSALRQHAGILNDCISLGLRSDSVVIPHCSVLQTGFWRADYSNLGSNGFAWNPGFACPSKILNRLQLSFLALLFENKIQRFS